MIIVLKPGITRKEETEVLQEIRALGYKPHVMHGVERTVIGAIGDERTHKTLEALSSWPQVERVMPVQKRYKLVSREGQKSDSVVAVRRNLVGGRKFQVMAGPCSVEDEKQLMTTAHAVQKAGATILRGGAFKPRTSPYEFQGLGKKGLKLLAKARRETGLAIITELLSEQARPNWWPSTRTSSRSGRATRRTSNCSSRRRGRANRSCSSAACP